MKYKGTPIRYKGGYKYQLTAGYETALLTVPDTQSDWIRVKRGRLNIHKGYAWDGPSGPTIDTKNFMRGSLVHDALYQLMREGFVHRSFRKEADELLYRIIREDGMMWIRAKVVYHAVRIFGGKNAGEK